MATPESHCAEGQVASKLAVVEDPEGWHVAGARSRLARNSAELVQTFEAGCQARDHGYMDLGSVHERTAAVFTIRLAQFNPAADAEDEDAATVGALSWAEISELSFGLCEKLNQCLGVSIAFTDDLHFVAST